MSDHSEEGSCYSYKEKESDSEVVVYSETNPIMQVRQYRKEINIQTNPIEQKKLTMKHVISIK
jgi:hypothetical protein